MAWEPAVPADENDAAGKDLEEVDREPRAPIGLRAWHDLLTGWRFAQERPYSLVEHIAMARRGEWTLELDGWRRHLAVTWVFVVAVPVAVVAHLAIWQTSRMSRCLSMLAVELVATTALHRLPLFGFLLPDVLDLTTWFPLTLL